MAPKLHILLALCTFSSALHVPREAAPAPEITPAPIPRSGPTRTFKQQQGRDNILSDLSTFAGGIGTAIESLGSAAASFVTSEFAVETGFLAGLPTNVASSLGSPDLSASPLKVLNLPNYANWTDQGWNMRFRANAYKSPNLTTSKLDDLANGFLIGTSIQALPAAQQTQARNLTSEIYVVQQGQVNLTFSLAPAPSQGASGEIGGGGASTAPGGNQTVKYPVPTTDQGDVDGFTPINSTGLFMGNETNIIQRLNVYAQGAQDGNATSFLVPIDGLTIVSDIDDTLRVTKIWNPQEGILNTFALPFTPWMNMPDVYTNWSQSITGAHFHYLTTTPEQITPNYMEFIYGHYPGGSFDTRPLNFSDVSATLSIRKFLLDRVFQSFPKRKFVLMGDTSNSDVMRDYPQLVTDFPGQVQCILLRNVSSTDSTDELPYDTSGFQGLNSNMYMFYNVPDDLMNLDIASGKCVNKTVTQNVSFGYQNLPLSLGSGAGQTRAQMGWAGLAAVLLAIVLI